MCKPPARPLDSKSLSFAGVDSAIAVYSADSHGSEQAVLSLLIFGRIRLLFGIDGFFTPGTNCSKMPFLRGIQDMGWSEKVGCRAILASLEVILACLIMLCVLIHPRLSDEMVW
jgi:hypothetical protein